MLFLIEGRVERSGYMEDRSKPAEKVIRIVEADTDESAQEKFIKHFNDQNISYCTTYYAYVDECNEVIR
jgi:hypothetical protein